MGTTSGGGITCNQCPEGSIRTDLSSSSCSTCDKGFRANKDSKL